MNRGAWVGYSPWGCKESDTTEWLSTHTHRMVRRVQLSMVLVHSGCYHRISQAEWLKQQMFISLSLEAGESRSKVPADFVSAESPLACS